MEAYKVGPGCFFPYDKVIIERQGDTGLKVIQPFGARTKERGTIAENTRPLTEISLARRLDVFSVLKHSTRLNSTWIQENK